MAKKNRQIIVQDIKINISIINDEDYISLTDIASGEGGYDRIQNWIRNKNTIEYLAAWEGLNNDNFNSVQMHGIRTEAGVNRFVMSPKQWIERTNAIGIISKTGRYGGTYAHIDIALEFASWLNPVFKIYLITEFKRLKEVESNQQGFEWDIKRILTKVNYTIHTDAIKDFIIPKSRLPENKQWLEYAGEADILNVALFGYTAKEWKSENPQQVLKGYNIRDMATINQLAALSNLEVLNSEFIKMELSKEQRLEILKERAKSQLEILNKTNIEGSFRRLSE